MTRFVLGDEVKVFPAKKNKLYFGIIEGIGRLLKARGVVLESDYDKRLKKLTYFIEFEHNEEKRYWFLEDEIYLI